MCITVFNWQPHQPEPLQLIANRDEFYQRPTQSAHFWPEQPSLFAGKDLQAGGSWMGASLTGKFALITNYRAFPPQPASISRGQLITDYLNGSDDARTFTNQIEDSHYDGFNLLLLDQQGLHYYSNRQQGAAVTLPAGVYGLCNHLLDTPWPKVTRLKRRFIEGFSGRDEQQTLKLLHDSTKASISELPDTGLSVEMEQLLSSIYIRSSDYGTRSSSLIRLSRDGELSWLEQQHSVQGMEPPKRHQMQLAWSLNR